MKHIHIKFIFCSILTLLAFMPVKSQEMLQNESDSISSNDLVQLAFRKVSQRDLLGGISVIDINELTKKNYNTYSLDNIQGYIGGWNGNSLWGMDSHLV